MTSDEFYDLHIGYVSRYAISAQPNAASVGDIRLQFWPSAITLQVILSRSTSHANGVTLTCRGIAKRNIKYEHRSIRYAKPTGSVRIA